MILLNEPGGRQRHTNNS